MLHDEVVTNIFFITCQNNSQSVVSYEMTQRRSIQHFLKLSNHLKALGKNILQWNTQ
jgi:hypothetical protein